MRPFRVLAVALLASLVITPPAQAQDSGLSPPAGMETHPDGRASIQSLYGSWLGLVDRGWKA